jgi:endonuclease/exonuclease/phosphatase family metal-dependent hydrolase
MFAVVGDFVPLVLHSDHEMMCKSCRILTSLVAVLFVFALSTTYAAEPTIRVATYNTSLYRDTDGQLIRDLESGNNQQARRIAEVIQRVRPDVLLVNEFDFDAEGRAAELFRIKYLAAGQNGCEPIEFTHQFIAPVNTGKPSGRDLDNDGRRDGPADAIGFGRHEGQYGMLVLSKFPIQNDRVRTFQKFLWRDLPNANLPTDPKTGQPFYDEGDLAVQSLSSKSFWDVPISIPKRGDRKAFVLHLLCSHPTPPVFDGAEDRNGRRNHDEIRMVADYISGTAADYLTDDAGIRGALAKDALFVVLGDLNCDPLDGEGIRGAMDQLLKNPRVDASFTPSSEGGASTVKAHADQHEGHRGDPSHVTSNFTAEGHGCLRIDYALPSKRLKVVDGGVFWPVAGEAGSAAVGATDHRAVWIDMIPASDQ